MTATEELRRLLDERGVDFALDEEYGEKYPPEQRVTWSCDLAGEDMTVTARDYFIGDGKYCLELEFHEVFTTEQAIEATLGREPWVNPTWERWHKSLKHDEIKSIGDAVEQLMHEVIEFGGDMGPNGNTYNGIDEGDVLTAGYINEWVERFENMLGRGTCKLINAADDLGRGTSSCMCFECGYTALDDWWDEFNFCPNCGRKVVVE